MDVFKCIHCGGTELGGFRFDAVDEEGNDCVVDICMDCLARISGEHGASEKENQLNERSHNKKQQQERSL
jgi:hypothetical protein